MRRFERYSIEELERFRDETRNTVKVYHIALFKNHDYCNTVDRLRMETIYRAAKVDLKDVLWEIEGRTLGIIS